ncbi:MAG: hypothetical protein RLY86_4184, partial [Pseudomonadota bacterium]
REKQTLFGLLLLPLIAFLMIGFYKILLEGAWQVVPRSLAPTLAVVLVDPGGPLPDPAIAVGEAVRRLSLHPMVQVTVVTADPGDQPVRDREIDLLVAVRDGRLHIAVRPADLDKASFARDLLLHGGADPVAAPPPGAPFDVRVVQAPEPPAGPLMGFIPFYMVLMLSGACASTGTAGFVADLRKGMLRGFLTTPVRPLHLLLANVAAVVALALVQALIVLAVLMLYGEVRQPDLPLFVLAMVLAGLMMTAVGFVFQSFRPSDNPQGGVVIAMAFMLLVAIVWPRILTPERTGELDLVVLLNPAGAAMDLIYAAISVADPLNPVWMSMLSLLGWGLLAGAVAAGRFIAGLEPDWSRR